MYASEFWFFLSESETLRSVTALLDKSVLFLKHINILEVTNVTWTGNNFASVNAFSGNYKLQNTSLHSFTKWKSCIHTLYDNAFIWNYLYQPIANSISTYNITPVFRPHLLIWISIKRNYFITQPIFITTCPFTIRFTLSYQLIDDKNLSFVNWKLSIIQTISWNSLLNLAQWTNSVY